MQDAPTWHLTLSADDPHAPAILNLYAAMQRLTPGADVERIARIEAAANEAVAWRCMHLEHPDPTGVRGLAEALVLLAEMAGAVVRIDAVPLQPLRQGNYHMRPDVYVRHAPGPDR